MPHPIAFDLLRDLKDLLQSLGLRWYLFGAQAVVVHGRPRLTEDVDVTVELGTLDSAEFVSRMELTGFKLANGIDDEFVRETHVLPFVHTTGMPLDVVLAGSGLESLILDQVQQVDIYRNLLIPVISPEHLVVVKILAGRSKDIDDVRGILLEKSVELEHDAIRDLLGQLEEALGQSDLVPTFDDLLAERRNPS